VALATSQHVPTSGATPTGVPAPRTTYYNEWRGANDEHPDSITAVELFGTWRAALAAAGL
jgi:hypothetical protein